MEQSIFYKLPELEYGFGDLNPYVSEKQMRLHYEKHHQAYIDMANKIISMMHDSRERNLEFDTRATARELSFNVGGHILHSLFWGNLMPPSEVEEGPKGKLLEIIKKEFKGLDNFKNEFSQVALKVEGSGWSALGYCQKAEKLFIVQIEKHNNGFIPGCSILMVLDVFEHAYYLDYENNRKEFINNFWKIINWTAVESRLKEVL